MYYLGLSLLILVGLVILFTLLGTLLWGKKNPGGGFVACGNNDVQIGWSDDGITWTASTHVDGGLPFGTGGVAYYVNKGNGIWVAGGNPAGDRTRQLLWSDDQGKTWHDSTGEQFGSNAGAYARYFQYGGGRWVAGGNPAASGQNIVVYSNDGKNWQAVNDSPFGTGPGTVNSVNYINNKWFLGGNGGTGNGSVVKIWSSNDGINWTAASGTPYGTFASDGPGQITYGNGTLSGTDTPFGVYVSTGTDSNVGSLWRSLDGQTWYEATTNPFTDTVVTRYVQCYNGIFVAVGNYKADGTICAWSTDGDHWIAGTGFGTLTNYFINTMLPPNKNTERWFIGGGTSTDGVGYYSTDGKDWTIVTDTLFTGGDVQSSTSGWSGRMNGSTERTVAVGKASGALNVYYSDDRVTWNAGDSVFGTGTGNIVLQVGYG